MNDSIAKVIQQIDTLPMQRVIRQIEKLPIHQMMRQMENSPAYQMIKQIERLPINQILREMRDSPTYQMINQMAEANAALIQKMQMQVESLPIQKMIKQIEKLPINQILRDMGNSPAYQIIKQIENLPIHQMIRQMENYQADLVAQNEMQPVQIDFDNLSKQEPALIEDYVSEFADYLYKALLVAKDKAEVFTLLSLFLSIFAIVRSEFIGEESSVQQEKNQAEVMAELGRQNDIQANHNDDIENKFNKIVLKIDELLQDDEIQKGIFYIVVRPVPMNDEQRYFCEDSHWLLVGQEVEVIETDGKCIFVKTYDFENKMTKTGWVLKKYLRRSL